jgi:hypothetical protein
MRGMRSGSVACGLLEAIGLFEDSDLLEGLRAVNLLEAIGLLVLPL